MTLTQLAALWAQPTADGRKPQPQQVKIIMRAIAKGSTP